MKLNTLVSELKTGFEKRVFDWQDAKVKKEFLALNEPAKSVRFNIVESGLQFESAEPKVNWVRVTAGEGFRVMRDPASHIPTYVVTGDTVITHAEDKNFGKPVDIRIPCEGFAEYVASDKIVVLSFEK